MPQLYSVTPRISVGDLERSIAFYRDLLGFRVGAVFPPESPTFALLEGGRVALQLSMEQPPGTTTIYFEVDDAAAWHELLKNRVPIAWGPEVYFYQRREFAVMDPDGHMIILSSETTDPPTCRE
ncbi:MAG: VOC family protein [Gemmataceae bacterium]|nr:VOC family protein [Gemmataceae bacterium]